MLLLKEHHCHWYFWIKPTLQGLHSTAASSKPLGKPYTVAEEVKKAQLKMSVEMPWHSVGCPSPNLWNKIVFVTTFPLESWLVRWRFVRSGPVVLQWDFVGIRPASKLPHVASRCSFRKNFWNMSWTVPSTVNLCSWLPAHVLEDHYQKWHLLFDHSHWSV